MHSIFTRKDGQFLPTAHAEGVWAKGILQGSAITALIASEVERVASAEGLDVRRLTFELWRPVGSVPLELASRLIRSGRKITVLEVSLLADGAEVTRCTALLAKSAPIELQPHKSIAVPSPELCAAPPSFVQNWSPYFSHVSTRLVKGALERPGPAVAWMRLDACLVDQEANSAFVQAVQAADFAGGISQVVDMRTHTFINPELSIHFLRPPSGEWMLLDAETMAGAGGAGITHAQLSDSDGLFATVTAALLFEARSGEPKQSS